LTHLQVGADHQVIVDQEGEQQGHHHMPSQSHIVRPNLQGAHVHVACSLTGKPANLVSATASPAIPTSVVLNSQLHSRAMQLQNENFQVFFQSLVYFALFAENSITCQIIHVSSVLCSNAALAYSK
jgi:hypothetical protein